MKTSALLSRVFREVVAEAERNPAFGDRLRDALASALPAPHVNAPKAVAPVSRASKRSNRRPPGPFDPFSVGRAQGIPALRTKLTALTLDQLKDIVSEHAMDGSRLALKWKAPERLIELIIATVVGRSSKGDAFRETPVGIRGNQTAVKVGDKKPCAAGCGGTATAKCVRPPDAHLVASEGRSLLPEPPEPQFMWVCDTCGFEQHIGDGA